MIEPDLSEAVARWTAAGLISDDQGEAIVAAERDRLAVSVPVRGQAEPARRIPLYAEALGYLGGALAIGGLAMVVAESWQDLSTGVRLALAVAVALASTVGGLRVPEGSDPALDRLRGVVLGAGTTAVVFAAAIAVDARTGSATTLAQVSAAAAAAHAGALWAGRSRPIQQAAAEAAGLALVLSTALALWDGPAPGVVLWTASAVLVAVGVRRLVVDPIVPLVVGPIGMAVGSTTAGQDAMGLGSLLGLAAAGLVAVLATWPGLVDEDSVPILGVVAVILGAESVPSTLGYFSQDAGAVTGIATVLVGGTVAELAGRRVLRAERALVVAGSLATFTGAALVSRQSTDAAVVIGLAASVAMIVVGARPGRLPSSFLGAFGLLVYVPWSVRWFFPGEDVAALVVVITGSLILGLAVLLTRRTMHSTGGGTPVQPSP